MKTGNIVLIALGGVVVYFLVKNRNRNQNNKFSKENDLYYTNNEEFVLQKCGMYSSIAMRAYGSEQERTKAFKEYDACVARYQKPVKDHVVPMGSLGKIGSNKI
jgi:hypothetical protein